MCHNQESELPPLPPNCDTCHKPAATERRFKSARVFAHAVVQTATDYSHSNMTIAITRDFPVCFVIVVKIIHRNRRCQAKPHMRLAPVVTRSSFQIRQARSARSVTQTLRVERSKHFHRCAVLMRGSITRSTAATACATCHRRNRRWRWALDSLAAECSCHVF